MANFLVTGGAGFVGSNIALKLVSQDHKVSVLDNFSTGKRENLVEISDDINLIEGDLRELDMVRDSSQGIDYVLHLGALPSVSHSIEDPLTSHDVNATGTLNVLVAAKENKVKRVVFASSCAVYGDDPALPKTEEMKEKALSPYAISKLIGENYCRVFYSLYQLEVVSLRYFNVFGPRQDPTSDYAAVIPNFINRMLKGEKPTIYGDGLQSRDFVYVEDVARATLTAAAVETAAGQILNIGGGKSHSVNDLVTQLNKVMGTGILAEYSDERQGDIRHSLADISKAAKILNYQPEISFFEGLGKTVKWYDSLSSAN